MLMFWFLLWRKKFFEIFYVVSEYLWIFSLLCPLCSVSLF